MEISSSGMAGLAQMLSAGQLQQQHQTAVLKMANDQAKQNGENALQLLQAIPKPTANGALGQNIDIMV